MFFTVFLLFLTAALHSAASAYEQIVISRDDTIHESFPDLIAAANGDLVITYQESDGHGTGPVSTIVTRTSSDGGMTWSGRTVVAQMQREADDAWINTSRITRLQDDSLVIAMDLMPQTTPDGGDYYEGTNWIWSLDNAKTYLSRSYDNGRTWSALQETPVLGVVPDICQLADGTTLCGATRNAGTETSWHDRQNVYRSLDNGYTWSEEISVAQHPVESPNEGGFVQLDGGEVVCYMRGNGAYNGKGIKAISTDGGLTWSPLYASCDLNYKGRPDPGLLRTGEVVVTSRFPSRWFGAYSETQEMALLPNPLGTSAPVESVTIMIDYDGNPERTKDYGYSGWVELPDGTVYVTQYITDDAPAFKTYILGYKIPHSEFTKNLAPVPGGNKPGNFGLHEPADRARIWSSWSRVSQAQASSYDPAVGYIDAGVPISYGTWQKWEMDMDDAMDETYTLTVDGTAGGELPVWRLDDGINAFVIGMSGTTCTFYVDNVTVRRSGAVVVDDGFEGASAGDYPDAGIWAITYSEYGGSIIVVDETGDGPGAFEGSQYVKFTGEVVPDGPYITMNAHFPEAESGSIHVEWMMYIVYAGLPGDANGDGRVNETDAAILASNWLTQEGAAVTDGDFNGDGRVDDADAVILATNWHRDVTLPTAGVPEPSGMAVMVIVGFFITFFSYFRYSVMKNMRNCVIFPACVLLLTAGLISVAAAEEKSPTAIDVGDKKQLFIDDKFIESSRNIELVMNPPYQTGEVLIEADQPWELQPSEGVVFVYSSVLKDRGMVRVWYDFIQQTGPGAYDHNRRVGYAESKDGVHFVKPKLGLHEINGSKQNNVVLPGVVGGCAVWIDPQAPPEHRYKTQSKVYPSGRFRMYSSPDGIHWTTFSDVNPRGAKDTQTIIFWDDTLKRYLFYGRHKDTISEFNIRCRSVRRAEMTELTEIKNSGLALWPDEVDMATYSVPKGNTPVDYYGAVVFPYEEADGVYIMLAQAFWHWEEATDYSGPCTFDVRLAVSRDSKQFTRVGGRRPFLRLGPAGRFDSRYVWALPNPVRMGDEIWIYYVGSNKGHDGRVDPAAPGGKRLGAVSRAVMRLDGFVSVDAPYEGGELVTPAIRFAGNNLELNLDTSGGGCVLVELRDDQDNPIKGFSKQESTPLWGNSVRMPVAWGDNTDVGSLAGKPIKIRFIMRDCKLYAFQFKEQTT